MKRYHPIVAIVLGLFVTGVLVYLLNISDVYMMFILILGGFIATYISKTNKARNGFYVGLILSLIIFLPNIFIFKTDLLYKLFFMVITPILGYMGGLIAKKLRLRLELDDEEVLDNKNSIKLNISDASIIFGIFVVAFGLLEILISGLSISFVTVLLGAIFIVGGVFTRKGFRNKTFYLLMFSIVALIGLFSMYGLLYRPSNIFDNYFNMGIFILFLFIYGRAYLLRYKAVKLPWKDEW